AAWPRRHAARRGSQWGGHGAPREKRSRVAAPRRRISSRNLEDHLPKLVRVVLR
ncbi:hypothetical protein T492DRAFT_986069, partial [Pavlovales sp. CCMP2436]